MDSNANTIKRNKITLVFTYKSNVGLGSVDKIYEFSIDFSIEKKFLIEKKTEEARKIIQNNVINLIDNKDIRTIVNQQNSESIFKWIVRRLENYFPKNNIVFSSIAFREENTEYSIYESVIKEEQNQNLINSEIIKKIKDPLNTSKKRKVDLLFHLIRQNNLKCNVNDQVNNFTSAIDLNKIKNVLLSSTESEIIILDYICPPYIKDNSKGYIGLFDNVHEEIQKYNFNYNYHSNIEILNKVVSLFRLIGFKCIGKVVLCDWGLINIKGIRTTLKTDDLITEKLTKFYVSLITLTKAKYEQIQIIRLTDFGVSQYLPIGLPLETEEIKNYLLSLSKSNSSNIIDLALLEKLIFWAKDNNLKRYLLDWRNYKELDSWGEMKGEIINIIKTYSNILWILLKKQKENISIEDAISDEYHSLRITAYYDALIRYVEYKIYGILVSKNFSFPICLYQDPGFPMAGNLFRNEKMPVLFLDPESILNLNIQS